MYLAMVVFGGLLGMIFLHIRSDHNYFLKGWDDDDY